MQPTFAAWGTQGNLSQDPSKALENAHVIMRNRGKQTMDFTVHTFWWKSVLSKSKSLSFLSAFCQAKQDSVNILANWPIEQGGGRQVFAGFIFNRNSNFDFTLCMEESRIILHIFHVEFTINSKKYTVLSPVNDIAILF